MKILICDDHAVLRRGVKSLLMDVTPGPASIQETATFAEALGAIHDSKFDLVVLDLNIPGGHGLDLLKEVRRLQPSTPVMILTVHTEEEYAIRAMKAGAGAFLSKNADPDELLHAARRLLAGGRYITAAVGEALATQLARADGDAPPHAGLSDREFQVLRRLGSGRRVGEIAEELRLSVKTISTYRTRLLDKLNLHSTAELTRYALRHKLADDEGSL